MFFQPSSIVQIYLRSTLKMTNSENYLKKERALLVIMIIYVFKKNLTSYLKDPLNL